MGVIALASLRGLDDAAVRGSLEMSAGEFVARRPGRVVVTRATATVGKVLAETAGKRAHSAWVVDEEGRLEGVVTLSDLVRMAIKACDSHHGHASSATASPAKTRTK